MGSAPAADLRRLLAPDRVLDREIDRLARSGDASVYRMVPRVVVRPTGVAEVQSLFAWARRNARHLTFRAAGTSLSGQAVSDDVLVELGPFWRAFRVLDAGRRVWSQPGVVGGQLNRFLAPHARRLGPDPASIDTAMLGGILANNSSGMCCGVAQNSYHTLDAVTGVLADGTLFDSARPDADERLRRDSPGVHAGLARLRDDVRADAALAARIRSKSLTKTTTGYSLAAFLDYERPVDILARLLVGSEGKLGFIADATLRTVPDPPFRATALLVFETLAEAGAAVFPLGEAGAAALEILDAASLRAIRPELGRQLEIGAHTAALLAELRCEEEPALEASLRAAERALGGFRVSGAPSWTRDAAERARLWRLRKGLAAATGAQRPSGTAFVTEDVAVPVARLAEAIADCQALFAREGLPDTAIFGHARDGNLHFVLSEDLRRPESVARYDAFLRALVELVAGKYDGALKAEHGSGRNMAPFVRVEWGDAGWQAMWRVKRLLDPDGILNPGVVLSRDPEAHLRHLKAVPTISPLADRCIECGYCEPRCPSRDLTLTPRQRIVVLREIAASGDHARREALARDFDYAGVASCAGDGLCESACPVKIDTGALMRELRASAHAAPARWLAERVADALPLAAVAARLGLGLLRLSGVDVPRPARALPPLPRPRGGPRVVYFPSCLTRIAGEETGALPRAQALLDVLFAAGFDAAYPPGVARLCCGLAFQSKGFPGAAARAARRTAEALRGFGPGALVVTDASPCALALGEAVPELEALDFAPFWARHGLPRIGAARRLPGRVVLHPTCATDRSGGVLELLGVARAHAEEVVVPDAAGCCGFAGDRGFVRPELTRSATRDEAAEVVGLAGERHVSTTRSCEIGLERASGRRYTSLIHLVRESLLG